MVNEQKNPRPRPTFTAAKPAAQPTPARVPPSVEEVRAEQRRLAEKGHQAPAPLPAKVATSTSRSGSAKPNRRAGLPR